MEDKKHDWLTEHLFDSFDKAINFGKEIGKKFDVTICQISGLFRLHIEDDNKDEK